MLRGVHVFARDVRASVAFYQRAGLEFGDVVDDFARTEGGRASLEIGSYRLTRGYDPAFQDPPPGGATALQIGLDSREAVDEMFADLTGAGYQPNLGPIDAFWGARYAEVRDPDGNPVGFQSPVDDQRKSAPPI